MSPLQPLLLFLFYLYLLKTAEEGTLLCELVDISHAMCLHIIPEVCARGLTLIVDKWVSLLYSASRSQGQ